LISTPVHDMPLRWINTHWYV